MAAAKEALADAAAAAEEEPDAPTGVFVSVVRSENGDLQVNPQPVGDTRITEIETILGVALKVIKSRLGVG